MLTSFHTSTATLHQPNTVAQQLSSIPRAPKITSREHSSSIISAREQEVLHLIAYEYSSKEIAQKLFVSYETINSHRKNIMTKLDVKNTAGMVRVAFELGLLTR